MQTMTEEEYVRLVRLLNLTNEEHAVLKAHFGLPHNEALVPEIEVLRKRILMRVLSRLPREP